MLLAFLMLRVCEQVIWIRRPAQNWRTCFSVIPTTAMSCTWRDFRKFANQELISWRTCWSATAWVTDESRKWIFVYTTYWRERIYGSCESQWRFFPLLYSFLLLCGRRERMLVIVSMYVFTNGRESTLYILLASTNRLWTRLLPTIYSLQSCVWYQWRSS